MNTKNSTNVVWIDTSMHRCTAMEEDVRYPIDLRQGRDCLTPVGRYSILAGKPPTRTEADNTIRAGFWAFYAAVALTAFCAVVLALWPN